MYIFREVPPKRETSPGAYGFLAGLLVLLLAAYANAGCKPAPSPTVAAFVPSARTPMQAADAAVYIEARCPAVDGKVMVQTGTGVLVSETKVITAHHVLNCDKYPKVLHATSIEIELRSGERLDATYDVVDPNRDLARIRLRYPTKTTPITITYAKLKGIACAVTAVPERTFRCGTVVNLGNDERVFGDVQTDHDNLWFGNSGSGVYNEDGFLIGIATRIHFCSQMDWDMWNTFGVRPDRVCGGTTSSIVDSPVMP